MKSSNYLSSFIFKSNLVSLLNTTCVEQKNMKFSVLVQSFPTLHSLSTEHSAWNSIDHGAIMVKLALGVGDVDTHTHTHTNDNSIHLFSRMHLHAWNVE